MTTADLYLRLSDFRCDDEGSFPAREAKLRDEAARLGWAVHRVIVENDMRPDGSRKPASAWKRTWTGRKTENGRKIYRVERDGWRSVIADLETGAANAVLAEDLDRTCRDMADLLDLLDAIGACGGNARSLSGSLTLTDGGTSAERTTAKIMVSVAEKSSDDTSRRVRDGRERWKDQSYGGGRRPYGYQVAPDSEQYHRTLTVAEAEAAVITDAATAILERGVSLKAKAAELREAGVPTVTGAPWTASTLRDVLSKRALAGLTDDRGNVVIPAILEQDQADRLRDLFDGRKNPGTSNAPRWLLSGHATCGVCAGPVKCTGGSSRRAYTCVSHGHVRRNAVAVDELVAARCIALIERDAAHLLEPAPEVTADAKALRASKRKLTAKRDDLARLLAEDILTEAGVRKERRRLDARLAEVTAQLAASGTPDPLPEFRDPDTDALAVWGGLGLARQRAVVRLLYDVTIMPAARQGARFDPDTVRLARRTAVR
jgi:DNA invertase Pin-like site-specific DNA recombinase